MFSRKQMIKLLAPLIVEQIMAVLVGMVDVVMVAAVGESAVSGVSLVDSISVLIIQIMGALATGGAVISAQYLGKEQPRDARKAAGQLILVTMLVSVIIAGTALVGDPSCWEAYLEKWNRTSWTMHRPISGSQHCPIPSSDSTMPARPCSVPWATQRYP